MLFFNFREAVITSPAKRDKLILANLFFSLLVNAGIWAALIFNFLTVNEYIILRFNIYFGISSLGPWFFILVIPFIQLLIIVANNLFSFYLYLKEQLLSYFLSFAASFFSLIILVAAALIIYENW